MYRCHMFITDTKRRDGEEENRFSFAQTLEGGPKECFFKNPLRNENKFLWKSKLIRRCSDLGKG